MFNQHLTFKFTVAVVIIAALFRLFDDGDIIFGKNPPVASILARYYAGLDRISSLLNVFTPT